MELDALRARIAEILERLAGEGINALSAEDLTAAQGELKDCFQAAKDIGGADGLELAKECHAQILAVREEQVRRAEEDARLAEEYDRLAEDIADPVEVEEDPEPEAAPEVEPEIEVEDEVEPEVEVLVPVAARAAQPVAAAAPAAAPAAAVASRGASISRVAANRRPAAIPAQPKDRPLTASFQMADDGRIVPKNRREVIEALASVHDRWSRTQSMDQKIPVLHVKVERPESRDLTDIASAPDAVTQRMNEAFAPSSLTASGGICAPFPVDYGLLQISSDERPVATALPSFQAPRGGIQFMPSYTLADVTVGQGAGNAIAKITRAEDAAASPSKPCATFTCKTVTSCEVYAITRCVTFGNWNARFYPELIDNVMSQVLAVQARYAEELLLSAIGSGSTQVDFNGFSGNGATASLLAAVGRAARRLRHSNRAPGATIRVAFPNWVPDLIREDMSARLANSNDQFSVADAWWNAQLALRGVTPWYFLDGENDVQELKDPIAQGALPALPRTVVFYAYFEGAWTMLDGGTLDLGIVRDSTLNAANNFQMFAETFEGICNRGLPSLRVNATICPTGASAGTFSPDLCGS